MSEAEAQLERFIARYTPDVAALGRAAIDKLTAELPNAFRLVYDNYNALAVGFSPDEKAGNAILSVVLYPRWVSLFCLQAAEIDDRHGLFKGKGSVARHIILNAVADLDRPEIRDLILQALTKAKRPLIPGGEGRLIIKSVSAKQRARRPG